ncbi:MAG: GAF domain-containing sensor histidine kinase [Thermomicrobiales bacterium]
MSRGLLWILLACYAGAIYLVAVTRGGVVRDAENAPWWLTLAALLIVVATFLPVHNWLRRNIDRLIYDWHDDPYAAIAELSVNLDLDRPPELRAIVPTIAETIAATLKLPYVAISAGESFDGSFGVLPRHAELLTLPLAYHGTAIGRLHAAPRRTGEDFSPSDERLLRDLARQVGIALYAAQLGGESLQASLSRRSPREEERRRIRRDLHDGLGPTLASLRLQLGAVRRAVREQPDEAEALIDELRADVRAATSDIRRLIYGLRPPLLDEHGLLGALRSLSGQLGGATMTLEIPESLPPLGAAIEVAVYRIASEAVQNVAKHAGASNCTVRLVLGGETLTLEVRDDGRGLPNDAPSGVGLVSMRERAAELGGTVMIAPCPEGGTRVVAVIPCRWEG